MSDTPQFLRGNIADGKLLHRTRISGSLPSHVTTACTIRSGSIERLRAARNFAVDLVYPRRCAGCGRRGVWLCAACEASLECFSPPWCSRCGMPEQFDPCRCAITPEALKCTRSVGPFDGWLRGAIVHLKYHGEWDRAEDLSRRVCSVICDMTPCDAVVAVPLHPSRLRQRGFNQSQVVAEHVGRMLELPAQQPLQRTRRTTPQVTLDAAGRRSNVANAFIMRPGANVAGRSILLIDDVITTGSTLAACAEVLLAAGARSVEAATLAREL
jgi:competence protein ComFC